MRDRLKKLLRGLDLYYPLNYLRQMPAIVKWLRNGCPSPAPHAIKMNVIRSYLRQHSLKCFIETGTNRAETLLYMSSEGIDCISIELSEALHTNANKMINGIGNVRLIQGNSGQVMPRLLETLKTPALFWLDAHYSGGTTKKGVKNTPVSAEINAILKHFISDHVILIDDAHCFDGTDGYPHLDDLLRELRQDGKYKVEVSMDIIRLVPRTSS